MNPTYPQQELMDDTALESHADVIDTTDHDLPIADRSNADSSPMDETIATETPLEYDQVADTTEFVVGESTADHEQDSQQQRSSVSSTRLGLRSTRRRTAKCDMPADDEPVDIIDRQIDTPVTSLQSLLEPRQIKEVRRQLAEVRGNATKEIAKMQIDLAADRKMQQVQLEGERRRAALRADNTDKSGELLKQASQSSANAIEQQLIAHQQQVDRVVHSRCSDQDKRDIQLIVRELTQRRIKKIGSEHGVPAE